MTTNLPTHEQVERAQPLDFPQRRQDLGFTVKAIVNGYQVEINFTGDIDQLQRITRRLADLGAEPMATAPALTRGSNSPMGETKPRAQRVAPAYNGAGEACCPVHRKPLSYGQYGMYCSCKATGDQVASKNGFCGLKFES